ncbi:prepilin-type N-terminal cleavage/methylation domain-containing protein [Haliovirga abyssi]|uniref:Prepilin-type N-terminal cleavage/methylation domain-containing protein n=1 Tax=Haliovirga abyssi TaxID=2996794 RepID=A0AAU9D639_9FUSO|nr:prepilin-type N-terminal cleavage/methylation domain-containing protein [Haliovirga abyssi]BDU51439.1 hypothetical protein HLVA_20080 [Haliovirga abyssi]
MKNRGFTLIELMISIAVMGFIMAGIGKIIIFATKAYTMNVEITDSITKIKPVLKRIENKLIESNLTVTPELNDIVKDNSGNVVGVRIKDKENNYYWYWWDENGNGTRDTTEDNSDLGKGKNFYRDNIPIFRSKGTDWAESSVKLTSVKFVFYKTNNSDVTTVIENPNTGDLVNADYMKIIIKEQGAISDNKIAPELKFSTGFKFK